MGVQGLLGILKSASLETNISQYKGKTVGIDGYAWLHRGAISCARDLATGKYTTRIEKSRESSRAECLEQGIILLRRGQSQEAEKFFQKAVDITPEIVAQVIEILRRESIQYVVAPYEADAQLVYLEKIGIISAIISEDSDLLVFGARVLLTKMDEQGKCVSVERKNFKNCKELVLADLTDSQFRAMALFSGCDYSNGIPQIGLKKAHYYIRKYTTAERALRCLRCDGYDIPANFEKEFEQGDTTFQYQRVYSISEKKLVHLNDPPMKLSPEAEIYVGQMVEDEICQGVASGNLNPFTKKSIKQSILHKTPKLASLNSSTTTTTTTTTSWAIPATNNRVSIPTTASNNTKITEFFTPLKQNKVNLAKHASTSYTPKISSRPAVRSNNNETTQPSKTPETVQKSLVRRRIDRFMGPADKNSIASSASSQATITDPISSTAFETTLGNTEEKTESIIQKSQAVSKFFSSVPSRSKTVEDSSEPKVQEDKFVSNFISSVTSRSTTLDDSFKFPSDSDSDDDFDTYTAPSQKPIFYTPTSSSSSTTKKNLNIWSRSSKIIFEKKEDNKITALTTSQREKVADLQKFAYSTASSTSTVTRRSSAIRSNVQMGVSTSSYETPQSTKPKTFKVADPRELIDPDSDSGSSDVETPKHMRVSHNVSLTRKDTSNCSHLQSPTRGTPTKKIRVTTTTSRALFTTTGTASCMVIDVDKESSPTPSLDSLSSISNKFSQFSYVPKK
ncbi:uncharacterized protein SAPINGB_P005189 [Magnusiomyces paraingens]|uniref:Uncharacterized protein n=1 Tax=Magnusiomyces paraingens TaxID=2606893 RepID=A0A5E8C5Z6_9ASCO|nr:uncharacterized protein SAPINGB_P005189 [Saprochaete ingens]VVT56636.1 unnamed protein product [Saprochaete ingens]